MPNSRTNTQTSSRGRTSSRAGTAARTEIINTLKEDHKRAKKAFRDFEKLDPHEDPEACQELVMKTLTELEIHTTLEEEIFYPAARNCLSEEDMIDEAEVEHMTAKMLIEQLRNMKPEDEKYAATFTVLGEYIKHHVREEENEMFPQVSHAKMDWQELQVELEDRRQALMEEKMPEVAMNNKAAVGEAPESGEKKTRSRKAKGRSETDGEDLGGTSASDMEEEE